MAKLAAHGEKWTAAEDQWLREHYLSTNPQVWVSALKRTESACRVRANSLGLRRPSHPPPYVPPTNLVEDVRQNYPAHTIAEIARRNRVKEFRVAHIIQQLRIQAFERREPTRVAKIREMAKRHTYGEVARVLGISRGCVAGVLRDYGREP